LKQLSKTPPGGTNGSIVTITMYVMNDVKLECVADEKDLGVIVSDDLKSGKQCSEAVKKANRMLGMIK